MLGEIERDRERGRGRERVVGEIERDIHRKSESVRGDKER